MPEETIEGMNDLLKSMEALPLVLQKTLIVRSLRKGGEPIREEAARNAPDDPETPGSRIEVSVKVQVREQTADGAVAVIGPSSGGFVGIFSETGTAHQTAQPWLSPAFDSRKEEALSIIGDELGDGIESEFAKRRG